MSRQLHYLSFRHTPLTHNFMTFKRCFNVLKCLGLTGTTKIAYLNWKYIDKNLQIERPKISKFPQELLMKIWTAEAKTFYALIITQPKTFGFIPRFANWSWSISTILHKTIARAKKSTNYLEQAFNANKFRSNSKDRWKLWPALTFRRQKVWINIFVFTELIFGANLIFHLTIVSILQANTNRIGGTLTLKLLNLFCLSSQAGSFLLSWK